MVSLTRLKGVELGSLPELCHVSQYRHSVDVSSVRKKTSSLGNPDDVNGTVSIKIDLSSLPEAADAKSQNNLDLLQDKFFAVNVRSSKGTVVYTRPLTKVNSVVNIPVCALVLGHTIGVDHVQR